MSSTKTKQLQSSSDSEEENYGIVAKKPHLDETVKSESKTKEQRKHAKRLIIILEGAPLETIKIRGKSFELLTSDKHKHYLNKHKKPMHEARPDILHQCLLNLQDSPLNRAGLLQVYIHTSKNILIQVHPSCRVPRTFDRFAGLMVQLLHKNSISAVMENIKDKGDLKRAGGDIKLLKVIKNPVTDYLPVGCTKICSSLGGAGPMRTSKMVKDYYRKGEAFCVVVGAIAKGSVKEDYCEETISFSNYPMSAATTCGKILDAFEEEWGVL